MSLRKRGKLHPFHEQNGSVKRIAENLGPGARANFIQALNRIHMTKFNTKVKLRAGGRASLNPVIAQVLNNKHCSGCKLTIGKEHIDARDEALRIQNHYANVSERVKILFVGESPPIAFSRNKTWYFYAPGQTTKSGLFYNMISVMFKKEAGRIGAVKKEYLLEKFIQNCYLIDAVKCPINGLTEKEKEEATSRCCKYLNEELHVLNYERLVFIGKASFNRVRKHLTLVGKPDVLPFPRYKKNIEGFRSGLRRILDECHRARL